MGVDETGAVLRRWTTVSTEPVFHASTLRLVARWRFEPGREDGRGGRCRRAGPVGFSLSAGCSGAPGPRFS